MTEIAGWFLFIVAQVMDIVNALSDHENNMAWAIRWKISAIVGLLLVVIHRLRDREK